MSEKKNSFSYEKSGIIIFALSILSSGLNYLFQILSGRILSTIDYGVINSLFSIINIVSVIGSALGLSIVKHVAEANDKIGGTIKKIFKHSLYLSAPFIIIVTCIIWLFIKGSLLTSILTSISIFCMSIAFIFYAVLQGKQKFMNVSIFNLIQPVFKTVIGILLLWIGLHYNSVFVVMSIGSVIAMLYAYTNSKTSVDFKSQANNDTVKKIYTYFIFTLVSTICLTIYNNIDVLLVKSFFDENTVGLYSSASLFGKIILYIPTALTIIMIPVVAKHKGNHDKILQKTLLYSFLLSGFACGGLITFRKLIVTLLLGERYLPALDYIVPVCIMMFPLVGVTVLINYLIAKEDKWFVSISSVFTIFAIILLTYLFHNTIFNIFYILASCYTVLFVVLLVKSCIKSKKEKRCEK